MVELRGFSLPEQHLLPDAVVAFVDGELPPRARQRAAAHFERCALCATELSTQRQARTAVRSAGAPGMSAGLLAALRAIPTDADLPPGPETLAMTADGQLVAVQRPDRVAGLGSGPVLGSSAPLGTGDAPLGSGASVLRRGPLGRRGVQGAGVVAAGLVLGALAVVGSHALGATNELPTGPATANGTGGAQVVEANFGVGGAVGDADDVSAPPSVPSVSATAVPSLLPSRSGR